MDFTYSENIIPYEEILDLKVVDCLCKHVIRVETDKSYDLLDCSLKMGVPQIYWGYPDGIHTDAEMNRRIQIACIQHAIATKNIKPMRVVLGEQRIPWIDNLHTAIQNIFIYGEDIKIKDCLPYICDLSVTPFKVVSINNSVSGNLGMIKGSIQSAMKRLRRVHSDMYKINYTIKDFMEENEINLSSLTITQKQLEWWTRQ